LVKTKIAKCKITHWQKIFQAGDLTADAAVN